MTNTPDPTHLPLSKGRGTPETPCLQSKASLVHAHHHGYLTPDLLTQIFTDKPCWQNEVINVVGIWVNDQIPTNCDDVWARLDALTPRVVAATVRDNTETERRVNARLLCWLARSVLHLTRPQDRDVCEAVITAREAWLRGDATEEECTAWAAAVAGAGDAAWAAWAAGAGEAAWAVRAVRAVWADRAVWPDRAAWASEAAEAGEAAWADRAAWAARAKRAAEIVCMFEELLEQWEKACAEEGAVISDGWINALRDAGLLTTAANAL